jgi:hypothetical protein
VKHTAIAIWPVLLAATFAMVACLGLPSSWLPVGQPTSPPPAVLERCDPNPLVLCLVSFGIREPDQLLINLFVPPELPRDLSLIVKYKEEASTYSCASEPSLRTTVYCTGSQLPLGATISIEVLARQESVVLAGGDFVLSALELPTVPVSDSTAAVRPGITPLAPKPSLTPAASLTRSIGGTPPTAGTTLPSKTPPAGTAYPNP